MHSHSCCWMFSERRYACIYLNCICCCTNYCISAVQSLFPFLFQFHCFPFFTCYFSFQLTVSVVFWRAFTPALLPLAKQVAASEHKQTFHLKTVFIKIFSSVERAWALSGCLGSQWELCQGFPTLAHFSCFQHIDTTHPTPSQVPL